MKTVEVATPDAREVLGNNHLREFSHLLEQRSALKDTIKAAESAVKDVDARITQILTDHDVPKVQYGDKKVSICQGSRSTLSKTALLEHGVAAAVIEDCTSITTYNYLLVSGQKEDR
jgi:hypothetical protein